MLRPYIWNSGITRTLVPLRLAAMVSHERAFKDIKEGFVLVEVSALTTLYGTR